MLINTLTRLLTRLDYAFEFLLIQMPSFRKGIFSCLKIEIVEML